MYTETERDQMRKQFFDKMAEGWENRNYQPKTLAGVKKILDRLNLPKGITILDVGCGQGILLPFLRKLAGKQATLIALDASANMLKAVKEKHAHTLPLHSRAENMPLLDEYVDAVICFSAFPHFSDKAAVANEFYRVLKPGGKAYVLHLVDSKTLNCHHDKYHAVAGDHMPCADAMKTLFVQAGFKTTQLEEDKEYYFSAEK